MFKSNLKAELKVNLYFFIFILLLSVIIQTTSSKNLAKTTRKLERGEVCESNSDCKSGYCAYWETAVVKSKPKKEDIKCFNKNEKGQNDGCWWSTECGTHTVFGSSYKLSCKWTETPAFSSLVKPGYRCVT